LNVLAILILEFIALAAVIIVAGAVLTRYADALGERLGMGGSLAGMVLLATATSLPELAIDCNAAAMGAPDLAVGDLFGSSLINLLILACIDLLFRTRGRMLSSMAGAHTISATMSIVLTALALLFLLLKLNLPWLPISPGTVAIFLVYMFLLRMVYFDQRFAAEHGSAASEPVAEIPPPKHISTLRATIGYVAAAAVILIVAPFMAGTAEKLAEVSGLGRTFIGTTLVAVSTSLPEMVTTATAVRMGAFDLAVGNIFGSNSFNMTILLGVDLFYDGPLLASVSQAHAITATSVIVVTSVAIMGLLYRAERRYWLIEPDAALIILLVLGSLGLVYYAG